MDRQISRSILIADDDELHRITLRDVLEPRGFQTYLASNGEEALQVVDHHLIDCLLLDAHMPVLNGLDTLRILRQRFQSMPCIMLTGDRSEQLLQNALRLKVFTVLIKPVTRELVTTSVARALQTYPSAG